MTELPTPVRFAHYAGDVTADAIGQVMGPNLLGELLTVVSAEYDLALDRTRLGFVYGARALQVAP